MQRPIVMFTSPPQFQLADHVLPSAYSTATLRHTLPEPMRSDKILTLKVEVHNTNTPEFNQPPVGLHQTNAWQSFFDPER